MYCLLPTVDHARQLIADLRDAGLSRRYIHVLANEDVELDGLHKASLLQRTEVSHGISMGLGVGGTAGMLGGLLVVTFPPAGIVLGGGAVLLATTLAGAGLGALVSALVASGIPHHELQPFRNRILRGEILVMLDIPTHRIQMTDWMIERLCPEADVGLTHPDHPPS
jgi:hypothetical protein